MTTSSSGSTAHAGEGVGVLPAPPGPPLLRGWVVPACCSHMARSSGLLKRRESVEEMEEGRSEEEEGGMVEAELMEVGVAMWGVGTPLAPLAPLGGGGGLADGGVGDEGSSRASGMPWYAMRHTTTSRGACTSKKGRV